MNITNINIKDLNPKSIKHGTVIVVSGRRGSGKTTIAKAIIYYLSSKIRNALLISNTSDIKKDFDEIIPPILIHKQYKPDVVKSFLFNQMKFIEKNKSRYNIKKDAIIIMDDVLAQKKTWKKDESFIQTFLEGRHSKITIILSIQDILGVPSELRNNIDYLIIAKEHRKERKKKIFDEYWPSGLCDFKTFEAILNKCTEGYSSLFINIKRTDKEGFNISNTIFRWKPPKPKDIPPIKICNKSLWDLNKRVYDPNWRIKRFMKENEEKISHGKNDEIVNIHFSKNF
jgi:archaellum biogenesis ATPase FlaH